MASPTSSSSSLLCLLLLPVLSIALAGSHAKEFLVGGSDDAWRVPPNTTDSLNLWAEKNRFQVGDSLVWKYDGSKDSVLQVTRAAYLSCNRSIPIKEHKDGATVVRLRRSGAYYFIGGAPGACEEGERLIVVVLSERHSLRGLGSAPSPATAPASAESEGPAVAPTSGAASSAAVLRSAVAASLSVLFFLLLR